MCTYLIVELVSGHELYIEAVFKKFLLMSVAVILKLLLCFAKNLLRVLDGPVPISRIFIPSLTQTSRGDLIEPDIDLIIKILNQFLYKNNYFITLKGLFLSV